VERPIFPRNERSTNGALSKRSGEISFVLSSSIAIDFHLGILMDIDIDRYNTWNEELLVQAPEFAQSASKASVFVVSAHTIISDILDHPTDFGLSKGSEESEGSGDEETDDDDEDSGEEPAKTPKIWEDDIHISSATHRVFAG
jgi:hypothetical protein